MSRQLQFLSKLSLIRVNEAKENPKRQERKCHNLDRADEINEQQKKKKHCSKFFPLSS
jgi:hypothetical protein